MPPASNISLSTPSSLRSTLPARPIEAGRFLVGQNPRTRQSTEISSRKASYPAANQIWQHRRAAAASVL